MLTRHRSRHMLKGSVLTNAINVKLDKMNALYRINVFYICAGI